MKKYQVIMSQDGKQFAVTVNARTEQTARNKVARWYPHAEIVSVQYQGFYLGKQFMEVS